jgi:hypothetical protein
MRSRGVTTAGALAGRRRTRSLNGRVMQLSALALSFIAISVLVVTSSRQAFVAQNDNVTNQVSAGAVDLTDNDSTTAMFQNVTGLMPGATPVERCIDVTYTGSVDPLPVLIYSSGAPSGSLAPYLNLTIDVGTDLTPAFGDCTGFSSAGNVYNGTLQGFHTAHGSYATGASTWDPSGSPETRTFRFRVSVQDNAAAEGQTTTFGFSWETRTS